MEIKNRTLSNFAELVETGECKKFRGRLKTGVDLGTANTVLAVVDSGQTDRLQEFPHHLMRFRMV